MKTQAGTLAAPFPYFGGKSGACEIVWQELGDVGNYAEPFAGSAAMLLGRPDVRGIETINDADGFVANFWRAISHDAEAVAMHADWPVNEVDLFARHSWLVRNASELMRRLEADPDFYDAKIAGWWCWGACAWIGSGWCGGSGPWIHDGENIVHKKTGGNAGRGINRQLPHLGDAGQGINRQLPHLGDAGRGINRQLPHLGNAGQGINRKSENIFSWFSTLQNRLRGVRVACGDWERVVQDSVTVRHGLTGVFLDPPYTLGEMQYTAGGVGGALADSVRAWCADNGNREALRIVLCGHAGEHDALLDHGWRVGKWQARKGYAATAEAVANTAGETVWISPHCVGVPVRGLFD